MWGFMHFYCEKLSVYCPKQGPGALNRPLGAEDVRSMGEGGENLVGGSTPPPRQLAPCTVRVTCALPVKLFNSSWMYRLITAVITTVTLLIRKLPTECGLKNDPTSKSWLLANAWNFWGQILYASLAGFWPLMCCFWLKLLYVYEIGITPNFKFEFCSCTSHFRCWVILKPHPVHCAQVLTHS